jgi:hypothetical protein
MTDLVCLLPAWGWCALVVFGLAVLLVVVVLADDPPWF